MKLFIFIALVSLFAKLKIPVRHFYRKIRSLKNQLQSNKKSKKNFISYLIKILIWIWSPVIIIPKKIKRLRKNIYNLFIFSDDLLKIIKFFKNKAKFKKSDLKILFLTSVTQSYDEIIDPKFIYEDADYFCFTDKKNLNSKIWKPYWIPIKDIHGALPTRYVKWKMLEFFKNYDCVIWQDANIVQTKDITFLISNFKNNNYDLMLFKHPYRENVSQELYACAALNKISYDQVELFKDKYIDKFQINEMVETGLMLLNPKSNELVDTMSQVFYEMSESRIFRDQLFIPSLLASSKIKYQFINYDDKEKSVRDIGPWVLIPHNIRYLNMITASNPQVNSNIFSIDNLKINKKIDIILPVHNAEIDTMRCIKSILPQLDANTRLYVIDDFSEIDFSNRLKIFLEKYQYVYFHRNPNNIGYTKTLNNSAKNFATNDCFFVINSDTIYPREFFKKLTSLLFSSDNFGVVCSLGRNAGIFSIYKFLFNTFTKKNDFSFDKNYFHLPNDIHGACYGIKNSLIKQIGFLDENAFPMGYGEENDFYLRIKAIRKSVVLSMSTYFIHRGNQSFGNEKRNLNKKIGRRSLEGKHRPVIKNFYQNIKVSRDYIEKITLKSGNSL